MSGKDTRELKRIFAEFLFRIYKEYCNEKGCELMEVIEIIKEEIEKEYNKAIKDLNNKFYESMKI